MSSITVSSLSRGDSEGIGDGGDTVISGVVGVSSLRFEKEAMDFIFLINEDIVC